jgi:hypothetical protein
MDANSFINWLEGFLDANKNSVTIPQVREIRKKMKEAKVTIAPYYAIYDTGSMSSTNNPVNDEFLKEIESRKGAATMDELHG